MKRRIKLLVISIVIFLLAASPVFSLESLLEDLQGNVDNFSEKMAKSLPFNSTMGLNWSDAYIGKFFPAFPPHLGVGVSAGFTTMNFGSINDLAAMFDFHIPIDIPLGFPLLGYTVEARIGGLFFPFDIGLKYGTLGDAFNTDNVPFLNRIVDADMRYLLYGADIRFAVFKPKVMPVRICIGIGYNRLEGGISTTLNSFNGSFNFEDYAINIVAPNLNLIWETECLELKTQVSFPIFFITPYVGAGVSYARSKAGYQINSPITVTGDTGTIEQALAELGINLDINNLSNGFYSIKEVNGVNARLYGGLSLSLAVIKFDFTAMYNILGGEWGGTFGLRFQL
ncbi:MAG: hypothetical protein FWD13_08605 [Treponema sp.]|nr:hypothetical protein [Treponema sp.]